MRIIKHGLCALVLLGSMLQAHAQTPSTDSTVQLEQLTTTEVHDRIAAGTTTILIPIGATEQSGPFVALGKHNFRVRILAEKIAQKLGNALVAPVIAYVPEGSINPPTGHMRFAGTISIPDDAFNAMLEGAAKSFKQHGFCAIIFLGDHGGYQKNIEHVAQTLNRAWQAAAQKKSTKTTCPRALALSEYYRLSSSGFETVLLKQGYKESEIGKHGGLADTSLMLAVDAAAVRSAAMTRSRKATAIEGILGDPHHATVELGEIGMQLIVNGSVAAIRRALD
jgi:creatinine amidohydrolase/Fe(II)-dependent formamide hydrolase-like protein